MNKQPFFLELAYNAPHYGKTDPDSMADYTLAITRGKYDRLQMMNTIQVPPKYLRQFSYIKDMPERVYAAMLRCLDDNVGELMSYLKQKNVSHQSADVEIATHLSLEQPQKNLGVRTVITDNSNRVIKEITTYVKDGDSIVSHKITIRDPRLWNRTADAYHFYKTNWNPALMVYITERRFLERKNPTTSVMVYTNLWKVELFVNSTSMDIRETDSLKRAIWNNIQLQLCVNEIFIKAKSGNKDYTDHCKWMLNKS